MGSPLTRPARGLAVLLLLLAAGVTPPPSAAPPADLHPARPSAVSTAPAPGSPAAALQAFDSLLSAGRLAEARRLCAGQILRMFDFLAAAQAKLAPFIDTVRSREAILDEKVAGDWAWVKASSLTVFIRPLMGQDSLASVQAAHLYRSERGWLIAEIEELADASSPLRMRTGVPDGLHGAPRGTARSADSGGIFPVSRLAPEAGRADRLRLRLSLRDDGAWKGSLPLGRGQTLVKAESPSRWVVETRRIAPGRTANPRIPVNQRWLASTPWLALGDSLLRVRADSLAPGESDPARITAAAYAWVAGNFKFQLGAALFGTSAEVLRSPAGDCSEAAVLTAALLRARGVPSRIALGFASVGRGVFIGHAWCEAMLGGAWVGVDAALKEFPAGAERVKLAELDGSGDLRIAAANLMMRSVSNLDIQILAAWQGGRKLPLRTHGGNAAEADRYFQDILDGVGAGP